MKRVFMILVAVVLCVALTIPAIAVTITGYTDINIADYLTGREYVGDEIIVSYNMPLRPWSEYYGTAADGTQGIFATSTNIYFSQESEHNENIVYTIVRDFGTQTVTNGAWVSMGQQSGGATPAYYTYAKVNGVLYPIEYSASGDWHYLHLTGTEWYFRADALSSYSWTWSFYASNGTYSLSLGTAEDLGDTIYEYSKFGASLYPLGFSDGSVGVVDVSDIQEGANFDLTFTYDCQILTDGTVSNPQPVFYSFYLDENGKQIYMREEHFDVTIDSDQDTAFEHTATFTVPEGAAYFYLRFDTSIMDVKACRKIDWSFKNLTMTCALSALEEQSDLLEEINKKLDQIYNGPHGFDSSGSDFSGAADKLSGASDQMHDAMSGGMSSIGSMVNSPVFTSTLTTLGACFDAVFIGHEIEICGVVANPFALLAGILAVVILIPLALKFVFRKWGSGGGSGGESDA